MKTIKKAQTGVAMEKKTTITAKPKVAPKKAKTISQRLGDITLRDVKNAGEDTFQLITLGGYGKIKKAFGGEYKHKKIGEKKYGGKISKAKNGTSLGMKSVKAGFDKNPGVTRADIITAATKKAKSGTNVKKAQMGSFVTNEFAAKNRAFPASPKPKSTSNTKLLDSSIKKGKAINAYQGKKGMVAKSGTSMKKCKGGC